MSYDFNYGYQIISVDWVEIFAMISAFMAVGAVIALFFITRNKMPVNSKKPIADFLNIINFNCSIPERAFKAFAIANIVYDFFMIPTVFDYGVFEGFQRMLMGTLVGGILWTLVVYYALMSIYKLVKKFAALNDHLDVKEPEPVVRVAPAPQPTYPAAPVPAQAPTYAAPQAPVQPAYVPPQAPVYAAPQAPVQQAAPAYVAPQAPVQEAPVQVAPVVAGPKLCVSCGKEIKEGAKFCPFCGSNQ